MLTQPGDMMNQRADTVSTASSSRLRAPRWRDEVTRAPAIVGKRSEPPHSNKRSWEKEALIIGGSAGAGTAIGAIAGGKKGAGIGAAAGGVGGLIYDLITRDKK
jgi:hypothetical protein